MNRLIDIGGRRLEAICSGTKRPSIVFESGAGRSASDWDMVRSLINPDVRSVAYSRAGQGRSDPPSSENIIFDDGQIQVASAQSRTDDLANLLEQLNVDPPYVLVGHSLGGIYIRLFAQRFPDAVAGLVFIDSSHPHQYSRLNEAIQASEVPGELKTEFLKASYSPNAPVMAAATETGPFDHIPVAVLSQDPNLPVDRSESGLPIEIQPVWNKAWSELQSDIAKLSADSVHRVVEGAGHMVHIHSPEAVAEAIMGTVERSKNG